MAHAQAEDATGRGAIRAISGINFVLGAWLIISPAILPTADPPVWNHVLVGIGVFVVAGLRLIMPEPRTKGLSRLNGLLGIWLVFSPFLVAYERSSVAWHDVTVGILLVCLAWGSVRRSRAEEDMAPRRWPV